ncbi:phospholipase C [Granulicella aggregans]|uniref:phospholipase C n=1 Tax=Granulicella aggregans TaxID=474949 RepID=UPI0021DFC802|nr:alkaline phosphatase family protein [Granulicella aggregans]
MIRRLLVLPLAGSLILSGCGTGLPAGPGAPLPTITPTTSDKVIKHVVVIFGENVSFDHYFATYPTALNQPHDTSVFAPFGNTPVPSNLASKGLLTDNPNLSVLNGSGATDPFRLDPVQAATGDQAHDYTREQVAFNSGKMDLFPSTIGVAESQSLAAATSAPPAVVTSGLTMGYYDGNTVTAIWNYAQHYALNDHSFATTFGPSTPGALNLISGQTNGVTNATAPGTAVVADGSGGLTAIGDIDPAGDVCSSTTSSISMSGKNIGDLLNTAKITWGYFQGGFDLSVTNADGSTNCARTSTSTVTKIKKADYVPNHQPFQYYASTANPNHLRPTAAIGTSDQANHQYDIHDFTDALAAGSLPAVSFLKAPAYQDGNAGYSDPLDEQTFIVNIVNAVEQSSSWDSTAIILSWGDADGWYDHASRLVNGSATTADAINGNGVCISTASAANALAGVASSNLHAQGRCGYGPRLPLLVISSWAKKNALDSTITDQTSITRFIEDTFLSSTRIGGGSFDSIAGPITNMFDFSNGAVIPNPNVVLLDPKTGLVTSKN